MARSLSPIVMTIFASLVLTAAAEASDASGIWLRDNGESRVRISSCGPALCGVVTWVKDPAKQGNVGKRVFYDMMPAGDGKWKGKAFNPEDGKTYTGTMSLEGNSLNTAGCVLGGLICRSVNWSRQ